MLISMEFKVPHTQQESTGDLLGAYTPAYICTYIYAYRAVIGLVRSLNITVNSRAKAPKGTLFYSKQANPGHGRLPPSPPRSPP